MTKACCFSPTASVWEQLCHCPQLIQMRWFSRRTLDSASISEPSLRVWAMSAVAVTRCIRIAVPGLPSKHSTSVPALSTSGTIPSRQPATMPTRQHLTRVTVSLSDWTTADWWRMPPRCRPYPFARGQRCALHKPHCAGQPGQQQSLRWHRRAAPPSIRHAQANGHSGCAGRRVRRPCPVVRAP